MARSNETRPKDFVFIPNTTNPVVESRRPETRRLVAQLAMKNRPKATINSSSAKTGSVSNHNKEQSPSLANYYSPKSVSPPTGSPPSDQSSSVNSPTLTVKSVSKSPYSNKTSHFGFLAKGINTEGTKDYYSLGFPETKSKKYRTKWDEARHLPVWSPAASETTYTSSDSENASTVISHAEAAPNDLEDEDVESLLEFEPQSAPLTSDSGLGILTCLSGSRYPFDCLPIKPDQHTFNLIDFYLTGQYLSPAFTQGSINISQRVKDYRQGTWFPLALSSSVAMHALMAYIETTPGNPIPSPNQVYLLENVQAAYEGMRRKLANKHTQTDDSICMAVLLLMLTAQRIGDLQTFRRHAQGLRVLLKARALALRRNQPLCDATDKKWQGLEVVINGPPAAIPCKYCQDSHLRPCPSRSPSPLRETDMDGEDPDSHPDTGHQAMIAWRGEGFRDLIRRGFMSPIMTNFVEEVLIMAELAEHTRQDKLSAAVAVSHAWIDERPNTLPAFDTACQYAVRLCLYLSTWLEAGHNCLVVRRMATAVFMCLRHPSVNINTLLRECPLVLMWLSLAAGPFIEDPPIGEQWFSCLLARAQDATSHFPNFEFEEAINTVGNMFVWIKTMTPGARRFWYENQWDIDTAFAYMESVA